MEGIVQIVFIAHAISVVYIVTFFIITFFLSVFLKYKVSSVKLDLN